jgi:uncharacterized membrane protein YoaK (UPF0700 family)
VISNLREADIWVSLSVAFVGGYGDAASFVLAKTFTGHVTGNLVLGAIAVAAHDWPAPLGHLSAIVTFLMGIVLSSVIVRALKPWPLWPLLSTVLGIEVILRVAASLILNSGVASGVRDGCNMRGQLRLRGQDVCDRPAFVHLVKGCKKGVDVVRMRPGDHRCPA